MLIYDRILNMGNLPQRIYSKLNLENNNDKFNALFENALDAILITDNEGRYVDANPIACEIFGVPYENLMGKTIFDFIIPEEISNTKNEWVHFKEKKALRGEF